MRTIYTKEDRPQRLDSAQLIVEEIHDETMVYDPARNKAFCLNQTAAFVWKHSDGKKTIAEIAEMMAKEISRPVNDQVVWYAPDILAKDGLLAPSEKLPTIPAGVTRRAYADAWHGRDGGSNSGKGTDGVANEGSCLEHTQQGAATEATAGFFLP